MADTSNTRWSDKQRKKLLARLIKPELTPENIGRIIIFALILVLLYVLVFGDYGMWRINALQKEIVAQQGQIDQLKAERDSLEQERWRLINDPKYIEKVAREKYGMKKDGEVVYKFHDTPKKPDVPGDN